MLNRVTFEILVEMWRRRQGQREGEREREMEREMERVSLANDK